MSTEDQQSEREARICTNCKQPYSEHHTTEGLAGLFGSRMCPTAMFEPELELDDANLVDP